MFNNTVARILPWLPRGLVRPVAMRYISGETMESAVLLAKSLADSGYHTTIDWLGEDVETRQHAQRTVSYYQDLMETMARHGVERNVSIKMSQFGLRINPEFGFDMLTRLLDTARQLDFFIRLDMEDSTLTDAILDCYRRGRGIWPRIGTVLQSRLKRSLVDAMELTGPDTNIRLCKGIYKEPETIAYQDPEEINRSYLRILRTIMTGGGNIAVATHDQDLLQQVRTEFADLGKSLDVRLEYQALLGVPIRSTLEDLRDSGEAVRLYVPFGNEWYAYSLRRMRENPDLAGAVARNIFSRNRLTSCFSM